MSAALATDDSAALREIPLDKIEPNERNPRLIVPQDELDRLAESIDQEGILVPIAVYPKDDHFVLIDGERRFRCAQTLGLPAVPCIISPERSEHDILLQMFNIHLIRQPWRDMPTAIALGELIADLQKDGEEVADKQLRDITGLSIDRVRQLRYVLTLPKDWQDYIHNGEIPLNFFWEMKKNIIDPLAKYRPKLFGELGQDEIANAIVEKRIDGVISDTVGLRKIRPIINFAKSEAEANNTEESFLDASLRELIKNPDVSIDDVYEDTVQILVEVSKIQRRTKSMLASFQRLMQRARTEEERDEIRRVGLDLASQLTALLSTK